jgi:PPE-repeat protein
MDFISLPPEVTSALIHSGPGAESLIEAANAWRNLGGGLDETAPLYSSVVSSLTQVWRGPSSAAMTQAVAPFLTWLRATAQQCRQLASSVLAAAAAFTQTQETVVHPSVVAANRARLAQLLATNLLGINLTAIAQTEDQYQTMWVNNSSAMSRYQAATAQALQLPLFSSPPSIANPTAAAAQAAAVPATSTPAALVPLGLNIFAPGSDAMVGGLAGLLNLLSGSSQSSFGTLLNSNILTTGVINSIFSSGFPINLLSLGAQVQTAQGVSSLGGDVGQGLSEGEAAIGESGLGASVGAGLSSAEPTAAVGVGVSLGKLTAPPAVVGIMPAQQVPVQLASAASPLPDGDAGGFPFLPPLMPPPITAGAGSGWRKRKEQKYEDLEYGMEVKGKVLPQNPSAG